MSTARSTARSRRSSRTATRSRTSTTSRSHLAAGAALDSGALAGVALRGVRPRDIGPIALRLLSAKRSLDGHPQVRALRDVQTVRCVSCDGRPIPLHVDGDHIGDVTEAVFEVRPGALGVVS